MCSFARSFRSLFVSRLLSCWRAHIECAIETTCEWIDVERICVCVLKRRRKKSICRQKISASKRAYKRRSEWKQNNKQTMTTKTLSTDKQTGKSRNLLLVCAISATKYPSKWNPIFSLIANNRNIAHTRSHRLYRIQSNNMKSPKRIYDEINFGRHKCRTWVFFVRILACILLLSDVLCNDTFSLSTMTSDNHNNIELHLLTAAYDDRKMNSNYECSCSLSTRIRLATLTSHSNRNRDALTVVDIVVCMQSNGISFVVYLNLSQRMWN